MVFWDALKQTKNLYCTLNKAFKIGSKSRNTQAFSELLALKKYKVIPKHNKTRWNSELKALRGVTDIKYEDLCFMLSSCGHDTLALTKSQYNLLLNLVNLLEPFELITDILQGEDYTTISMVFPSIEELLNHIDDFESELNLSLRENYQHRPIPQTSLHLLVKNLRVGITKRFQGVISILTKEPYAEQPFSDCCYLISTFLDPLFKFFWIDFSKIIVST